MSSLPRSPRPEPGPPVANGFSLVELVIAVALLAGSLLVGVLSGQSNLLTMTRNLNLSSQESLIEQDIATIRSMAETYTWCSGAGTLRAVNSPTCVSTEPLTQNYYFPNVPPPASAPDDPPGPSDAIANFTQACQDGRLTAPLLALINASPLPTDLDLQRNAELADAFPPAGAQTHLLRIRYSYIRPTADPNPTGEFPPIDRDVLILPTVAAWCP
jgi:prepilin-type N-terminal cleavage/methylation domain-containing protein